MTPTLTRIALAAMLCVTRASAQELRPIAVPISDAESKAILARHTDATAPSNKTFKYTHRVMDMTMPMGGTARIEVFSMRPDKILVITTLPLSGSATAGWDGKIGWSSSAVTGTELLDSATIESLRLTAEFKPGAPKLTTSASSGAPVKQYWYGQRVIDGRAAKAMLTVTATDDSIVTYIDAETGLMAGMRGMRIGAQPIDTAALMLFGEYKRMDGIMLPMKTTIGVGERTIVTRIVEYDHKKIDAAKFAPPKAALALLARQASTKLPQE